MTTTTTDYLYTEALDQVREFMDTFDAPRNVEFWAKLIEEELNEVEEATEHLLKETADLLYVLNGFAIAVEGADMTEIEADEHLKDTKGLKDRLIKRLGVLEDMFPDGEVLAEAYRRVHRSNMSKVGDDGKPVRHPETGKILKGPNYVAPDLMDLI